jgi:hypothetical protein
MDGLSRRSRFETRVRTERDFLAAINRVFGSVGPLAGMTHEPILWRTTVRTSSIQTSGLRRTRSPSYARCLRSLCRHLRFRLSALLSAYRFLAKALKMHGTNWELSCVRCKAR